MKYKILLGLFITCFIFSIVLIVAHQQNIPCTDSCVIVQKSEYSHTFGIDNGYFGIFIFGIGSILIFLQIKNKTIKKRYLIHTMVIIGSLSAIYLMYIQQFVLKAYCIYCTIIDISLIISLILIIIKWKD